MEKRTLLAVILSVLVISGGYLVQSIFFPPTTTPVATNTSTGSQQTTAQQTPIPSTDATSTAGQNSKLTFDLKDSNAPTAEERVVIQTDLVRAEFSSRGGDLVSYQLLEHKDGDNNLEMIMRGVNQPETFGLALGPMGTKAIDSLFNVRRIDAQSVEFYRDFSTDKGPVRLTKRFDFKKGEYLFELTVTVDGGFSSSSLDFGGAAYTLYFGPQIGPRFQKLTQNYEYRRYYTYTNGKRKLEKVSAKDDTQIGARVSWAAIAGKYFSFIAVPDATEYRMAFSAKPEDGVPETSKLLIERPIAKTSKVTDTFRFYLGPKTGKALSVYDNVDQNAYKLKDMHLNAVVETSGILGPVESVLKWFLMIFYKIIPNYGVAIILLTLLVKIIMFPLTKKGSESTIKMQALSPKIKEIQDKYKDNPNKMNQEMAEFYKREGYNPMSGCLPMIIQIPIFFAMYNLFNNHFDLRGAMFIPGWIPDLSVPDTVWNFSPVTIPLLGWSNLRILPFLYVASQLVYGKVTQTPDQQNNSQMKMMLYAMPIIFFFVLYDAPAGLLLYWIMSNMMTMVQQVALNKYLKGHRANLALVQPSAGGSGGPKKGSRGGSTGSGKRRR